MITLTASTARAMILPDEGGVASELTVEGMSVLARTPWADDIPARRDPAWDEASWVARWRGGWQLCFPTAGQPQPHVRPPQGFHGTASQARWSVVSASADAVGLAWSDDRGLAARRNWTLRPDGLDVTTRASNGGTDARAVIAAEHLILGRDLLAPALEGGSLHLDAPPDAMIAPLDYDGSPAGSPTAWPGESGAAWDRVDAATPARVAALVAPRPRRVIVRGTACSATVVWRGLPHALLWEELAQSHELPWNGEVVALGIEPTTTAHGAGTGSAQGGWRTLAPGESMQWSVSLRIRSASAPQTEEDS